MVEMYAHVLVFIYVGLLLLRLYYQYKTAKMINDKDLIGKIKRNPFYIIRVDGDVDIEIKNRILIMNVIAVLLIVLLLALAAMTLFK